MRTVSSIAATGSVTALSVVQLAVAQREKQSHDGSSTPADMTAVASYPLHNNAFETPLPFQSDRPRRFVSEGNYVRPHEGRSSDRNGAQKRRGSMTPGIGLQSKGSTLRQEGERGGRSSPPNAQSTSPSTWLRRLSSSVSTSRDSSRTPSSRPGSAAFSTTAGSLSVSHGSSMTPVVPHSTPMLPNRLVKRASSLHSASGSSSPGSNSRLPIPTFKRPATSHQRSATLQGHLARSDRSGRRSLDASTGGTSDPQWNHYFIPRASAESVTPSKRRNTTGIPNPIKRVYPDRKYIPTLVSAKDLVTAVVAEHVSAGRGGAPTAEHYTPASTTSSPFPSSTAHFEEDTGPRRSFSIGDLLSTGPQPLWRRPATRKGRPWSSKSSRKERSRGGSEPPTTMGNNSSSASGLDSERPAKRRDITDVKDSQRSLYSSSSSSYVAPSMSARQEIDLNLGGASPYLQYALDRSLTVESDPRARTPSPSGRARLHSATHSSSSVQPSHLSAPHSEITSTIDSDSERRSLGDYSTDYQSDTAYDSFPTRTTRSSFGRRGPHIEAIFDDSPPFLSSERSTKLGDFISDGQYANGEQNTHYRHSTIEEEGSVVSTPVRSIRNKSVTTTPSARIGTSQIFSSSPPAMVMPNGEDLDWSIVGDEDNSQDLETQFQSPPASISGVPVQRSMPFRFGPSLHHGNSRSANSTPLRQGAFPMDRTNLFDWSEQQPSPSHPNNSPPRPRTVHGKKDQDSRGSRPAGRRPVSGMHARSHSVPIVPDLDGKRNNVVANKFGTWGVGSKAVTEDWNEDFDFDEPPLPTPGALDLDEKRVDSGHEMFVPRSIREQQENVVANISLLREWGLLIEELKELRIRAVALDILHGQYAQAWREVDAMIELADQETEEQTLEPRRSPPSSPGFDYSLFEDNPGKDNDARSGPASFDISRQSAASEVSDFAALATPPPGTRSGTRPRKDSELVAQSVIATLQAKRVVSEGGMVESTSARKVPFDTATLRHIVPYVKDLKRKVKDVLRETEGLYSSPHRRSSPSTRSRLGTANDESPFRNIFNGPPLASLPFRQQSRREHAVTDHDGVACGSP